MSDYFFIARFYFFYFLFLYQLLPADQNHDSIMLPSLKVHQRLNKTRQDSAQRTRLSCPVYRPIPLVKSSCLCGYSQGNYRLGKMSSSNLQGGSFLRLLSVGKVWKENNDPLVCSCAHPTTAHWRGIFVVGWLMVKTRLICHSPQRLLVTSETYVTDLARISRLKQADECISSFVNIFTFMAVRFY